MPGLSNPDQRTPRVSSDQAHADSSLPIALSASSPGAHYDQIIVGRDTRLSFHRTLRVPDNAKNYPLPAGFGCLPILRVADYAGRVPKKWLDKGGFFIPLYQREALFLYFGGAVWRPSIAKVCVGNINAVTGQPYTPLLKASQQDYVLIPEQKWLDGINSGDGVVRQFVAMPLGQGYTIEAQLTDEEVVGGIQICVYEPRKGRFPDRDPGEITKQNVDKMRKDASKMRAYSPEDIERLSQWASARTLWSKRVADALASDAETTRMVFGLLRNGMTMSEAAEALGLSVQGVASLVDRIDSRARSLVRASEPYERGSGIACSPAPAVSFSGVCYAPARRWDSDIRLSLPATPDERQAHGMVPSSDAQVVEMGIAAGGSIRQQIVRDVYGLKSWDPDASRAITIHLVNSAVYSAITGLEAPPTPISEKTYKKAGYRWYSTYDETVQTLRPAGFLSRILSVGQIDKRRGLRTEAAVPSVPVDPGLIRHISTPCIVDEVKSLRRKLSDDYASSRWDDVISTASQIIDRASHLATGEDYLLRGKAHFTKENYQDALADAGVALERAETDFRALLLRMECLIGLGSAIEALPQVEQLLKQPDRRLAGLSLRAEIFLRNGRYAEAACDLKALVDAGAPPKATSRLGKDVKCWCDCLVRQAEDHYSKRNFGDAAACAGNALVLCPSSKQALSIRARAFLALGKSSDALTYANLLVEDRQRPLDGFLIRSEIQLGAGNYRGAAQDASEHLRRVPGSDAASQILAKASEH